MIILRAFTILLVSFCYVIPPAFSQNQAIDSLQQQLLRENHDTLNVDILLNISFEYRNSIPDSTIAYARLGLLAAEEINYLKGEVLALRNVGLGFQKKGAYDSCILYIRKAIDRAGTSRIPTLGDAYNTLGTTYYFKGWYDSAVYYFEEGAVIFEEFAQWTNQAGNFANIGVISENQGNNLKALDYYQQALTVFERENFTAGINNIHSNMGSILEEQGKYEEALKLYEKVLEYDRNENNLLGAAITTGAIAGIMEETGRREEAMEEYRNSLQLFIDAEANCRISQALNNIGELHLAGQSMDSARHYFIRALTVADSCKIPENAVTARLNLGEYYYQNHQPERAEQEYLIAYDLAEKTGLQPQVSEASHQLYLIYKETGWTKQALTYLETHIRLMKELNNEENSRQIERMQAEYAFSKEKEQLKYEQQISELTYKNDLAAEKMKQDVMLVVLIVVILLVILLTVMYVQRVRSARKLHTVNEKIRSQKMELQYVNKELLELNTEKNTLIGIVAHDLKGPINQIRGLLQIIRLEKDSFSGSTQEYLSMMDESSGRSVEMIDRILDINTIENKKLDIRKERVELTRLAKEAVTGFEPVARDKDIEMSYENGHPDTFIQTDPMLLREIIDNLISNAIKFSPSKTTVRVVTEVRESFYSVKVKDEGPGISQDDQQRMFNKYQQVSARPTGNEKSTGLGLAIVKKYSDELGYRIECRSEGAGTEFKVVIPV